MHPHHDPGETDKMRAGSFTGTHPATGLAGSEHPTGRSSTVVEDNHRCWLPANRVVGQETLL